MIRTVVNSISLVKRMPPKWEFQKEADTRLLQLYPRVSRLVMPVIMSMLKRIQDMRLNLVPISTKKEPRLALNNLWREAGTSTAAVKSIPPIQNTAYKMWIKTDR